MCTLVQHTHKLLCALVYFWTLGSAILFCQAFSYILSYGASPQPLWQRQQRAIITSVLLGCWSWSLVYRRPRSRSLKNFRLGLKVFRLASRLKPQNTAHISKLVTSVSVTNFTPQSAVCRSYAECLGVKKTFNVVFGNGFFLNL